MSRVRAGRVLNRLGTADSKVPLPSRRDRAPGSTWLCWNATDVIRS